MTSAPPVLDRPVPGSVPSRAGQPAIVLSGLRKRYGGRAVVDGLDLEIGAGELFALLGPNGAGKTTTVEILEGYRKPDEGEVRVLGLDPQRHGQELRSRIGLMLQQGGVYPQARPREILRLYASFYRRPLEPDALLERVGLADAASTRYKVLSGGQKQRLGLALALVGRPELVVLDEPTAGMDPHAKAATRQLIADLRAAGTTVLLTTHELADVERLADRIAVIDHGRLIALGTMAELSAGAARTLRFRLARALASAEVDALATALRATGPPAILVEEAAASGSTYRVDGVEPEPDLVAALSAWCAGRGVLIEELRTGGGTLEERFLELTAGTARSTEPGAAA